MVLTSWEKGPFAFVRRSMCLYRSEIPAPCFGDQQSKSLPEWRNRVQQTAKSPLLARHIGSLRAGNQNQGDVGLWHDSDEPITAGHVRSLGSSGQGPD